MLKTRRLFESNLIFPIEREIMLNKINESIHFNSYFI